MCGSTCWSLLHFCCWMIFCCVACCTHWLSIRQSIDEHLYCFCFWALERNAAVNIHAQVFVWTCVFFSLGCIARSGALGHVVAPCRINEDSPKWLLHLHSPLQRGRFPCVSILVSTCSFLSVGFQPSQRHEAVTHCGFDFCFPDHTAEDLFIDNWPICMVFRRVSMSILCLKNFFFVFLLWSSKCCLYDLATSP